MIIFFDTVSVFGRIKKSKAIFRRLFMVSQDLLLALLLSNAANTNDIDLASNSTFTLLLLLMLSNGCNNGCGCNSCSNSCSNACGCNSCNSCGCY